MGSPANLYDTPRRDDIQGLRAVAVLAVLLYHAGVPVLAGGFVGVDIFFVISGFLITRLLLREVVATDRIAFAKFWARRAKRLLPNAALTLLVVLALTMILLPAYRRDGIAGDVTAAALFVSNFRFAGIAVDYFHLGDPPSPVLHFWSLGVEEQFYMVWPLLIGLSILAGGKRSIPIAGLLLAIAWALSLASNIMTIDYNQPAAFFDTQNRVWQLATGGMLGIGFHWRLRLSAGIRGALAWMGLAAILYSLGWYSDALSYPGLWALLPTFGTAALLAGLDAGSLSDPLQWALSTPPMRWIGDRSYALYLWHWPIIIFIDAYWPSSPWARAVAVVLALGAAALSYALVERPIRDTVRLAPWRIMGGAAVAIALVCTAGAALSTLPLPPASKDRSAAIVAATADQPEVYRDGCHLQYEQTAQPACVFGDIQSSRQVVLFGDSHAAQWFTPLVHAATAQGWKVKVWTKSGCPSVDVSIWYEPKKAAYSECDAWRRDRMAALLGPDRPETVILANWSGYGDELLDRGTHAVLKGDVAATEWRRGMNATVDQLSKAGIKVVLLADTPTMYLGYQACIARTTGDCGRPRQEALSGLRVERDVAAGGQVADLSNLICNSTECPAVVDGHVIYRDNNHLTSSFTATLWNVFADILSGKVQHDAG